MMGQVRLANRTLHSVVHPAGALASQVLQPLQVLEQAATEQLSARRGAERQVVEAQKRITQLDLALHPWISTVSTRRITKKINDEIAPLP